MDTERASDLLKQICYEADNRDFQGMVTAEKVATSFVHDKLREVQRVC